MKIGVTIHHNATVWDIYLDDYALSIWALKFISEFRYDYSVEKYITQIDHIRLYRGEEVSVTGWDPIWY